VTIVFEIDCLVLTANGQSLNRCHSITRSQQIHDSSPSVAMLHCSTLAEIWDSNLKIFLPGFDKNSDFKCSWISQGLPTTKQLTKIIAKNTMTIIHLWCLSITILIQGALKKESKLSLWITRARSLNEGIRIFLYCDYRDTWPGQLPEGMFISWLKEMTFKMLNKFNSLVHYRWAWQKVQDFKKMGKYLRKWRGLNISIVILSADELLVCTKPFNDPWNEWIIVYTAAKDYRCKWTIGPWHQPWHHI
jgi:hypothetical protein